MIEEARDVVDIVKLASKFVMRIFCTHQKWDCANSICILRDFVNPYRTIGKCLICVEFGKVAPIMSRNICVEPHGYMTGIRGSCMGYPDVQGGFI